MKYPILYPPDATDFFNMGLGPLTTSLTATVSEERNGSFILEAEVLTDDAIYPLLEHNAILKADAGHTLKDQRFKIKRIVPTDKGTAKIYAEHVSYLSQELSLKPEITIKSLNANAAIGRWKSSLNETNPFVVDSDITTTGSTKWRIDKVANPRQALGGVEGSLLDVYGGEYRFDNYHISLLKKRGTTANTVLAYGRNITSFEQELNITDTYTSVYPYAIYTDKNDNEQMVTIDGYVVDCENVSAFPNRVVKIVDFSSEFEHDEVPTKTKLQTLAEQYVTANDFGTPKVSIKVSFVDLSKTADYAEYQALEEVNLCDDVRVIFPKLGVDTVSKVTRTVWNVLSESYDEIEIGEKRASLSTIINDQGKQIGEAEKNANGAIIAANGKNTIFFGLYGTDGLGEPVANKLGDTWYKPNGEDTETYIWNGTIWAFVASTAPDPALIALIEENKRLVEEAQAAAEDAKTAGENAGLVAQEAKDKADQAGLDAGQALDNANLAVDKATETAGKVGGLETAVGLVTEQSANAVDMANQAKGNADTALGKANSAIGTAQDALNQSALAKSQAEEAIEKYLGMGMVPAWSWSPDGADRFTTVEPGENLLLLSKLENGSYDQTTGLPIAGNDLKRSTVQVQLEKGASYVISNPNSGEKAIRGFFYDVEGNFLTSVNTTNAPVQAVIPEKAATMHYIVWLPSTNREGYKTWKFEKGDTSTIYTPSPTDDYTNAVPSYIGFAIEPSDNPADYTWIRNPEKVEGEVKVELTEINGELSRKVSQETFDQLNSIVINHSTLISQNQHDIGLKANKDTVDVLNQTVTENSAAINVNAEAIKQKASQTSVDSLTGRVTEAEGSITTIAGEVELKANQTDVDTLNNTVSSLNSQLTVQAGKITALNTLTDGHTSQIGSLQSSYSGLSSTVSKVQNDLNGLSVGGRNYALNTADGFRATGNGGSNQYPAGINNIPLNPEVFGAQATIQCKVTISNYVSGSFLRLKLYYAVGTWESFGELNTISGNGEYLMQWKGTLPPLTGTSDADFNTDLGADILIEELRFNAGNLYQDWEPAPEDMATVSQMSSLTQTVDSINTTVINNNANTQSQINQLSNQITSVVGSSGQQNLVFNSDFRVGAEGWSKTANGTQNGNNLRWSSNLNDSHNGSYALVIDSRSSTDNWVGWLSTKRIKVTPGYKISLGVWIKPLSAGSNVGLEYKFYKDATSERITWYQAWAPEPNAVGKWQQAKAENVTVPADMNYVAISFFNYAQAWAAYSQPMVTFAETLGPYSPDSVSQSQITQLTDAINLRVIKNDIINQININDQGVLIAGEKVTISGLTQIEEAVIKTAHIANLNVTEAKLGNLSVSTAKIADAAITSAKIGTAAIGTAHIGDGVITNAKIGNLAVSGAKIQDATISSAKIINLDASKITANTLSAITTNTGSLNVSGWLTMSTENKGILGSYDFGDEYGKAYNYRWFVGDYRFSHRHLFFTAKAYNVTTSDTKGSYKYDVNTIYGPDYLKMRQYRSDGTTLICRADINADKIAIGTDWTNSAYIDSSGFGYFNNGMQVNGGDGLSVGLPGINVGRINAPSSYDSLIINDSRSDMANLQLGTTNFYINNLRSSLADFRVGKDGSSINGGRVVQSMAVYNRTYSGTANMYVTDQGTLGRTTSARKYKADIQPAYDVIGKAKKVMDINPSSWWDKGELADGVAKERYYGFIADEFAEIGLNEVVVYRDGEIESLAYDRIPMYHNVILSEHEKEILALKEKVQQLENEIRALQAA